MLRPATTVAARPVQDDGEVVGVVAARPVQDDGDEGGEAMTGGVCKAGTPRRVAGDRRAEGGPEREAVLQPLLG